MMIEVTNKSSRTRVFEWKLTIKPIYIIWGRWIKLNLRCSYGCLPENLLNRLRKNMNFHASSLFLHCNSLKLHLPVLCSVYPALLPHVMEVRMSDLHFIYFCQYPPPCCRNTPYIQYDFLPSWDEIPGLRTDREALIWHNKGLITGAGNLLTRRGDWKAGQFYLWVLMFR